MYGREGSGHNHVQVWLRQAGITRCGPRFYGLSIYENDLRKFGGNVEPPRAVPSAPRGMGRFTVLSEAMMLFLMPGLGFTSPRTMGKEYDRT